MESLNQLFTIQEVSQKCGVPKSTLRFWERRFGGLLAPVRSKGGQRRYSAEQVATITLIDRLKAEGLSLDGIGERISARVAEGSLSTEPLIERLGDRIAALVKLEVCRFLDGALRVGPQAGPRPGKQGVRGIDAD